MPPIIRETEDPAAGSAIPTVRPAATSPRPEDTASRPLPVALEVAVTVNGARTVDGSGKREPFSESTKTVLVFGNGAVLRLSSAVTPGQLLFVTNEKTKKEVVCQVVKSKNYRNVSGYVELEFTELMIGFWGIRFPNDRIGRPASARVPVPAAPAAVPSALLSVVAPITSLVPAAVKPAEVKPFVTTQEVPPPPAARLESQLSVASVFVAPPTPVAAEPVVEKSTELTVPDAGAPAIEEFEVQAEPQTQVVAPAAPADIEIPVSHVVAEKPEQAVSTPQENEAVTAEPVKSVSPVASVLDLPRVSEAKAIASPAPKEETIPPASDSSAETLKLETARLQKQLSTLLFAGKPAAQPVRPAPVPVVDDAAVSAAATKLLELAKIDLAPAPVKENKPAIPVWPVIKPTLEVEEVKIPAWLEPLARNDTASPLTSEAAVKEEAKHFEETQEFEEHSEAAESAAKAASASASQGPRFGYQLLPEEKKSSVESASRGSKKGVLIATLAAGILVAAAGGTWYLRQSSNLVSGILAVASQTSGVASAPVEAPKLAPARTTPAAHNVSSTPATSSLGVSGQPVAASNEAAKPAANTSVSVTTAREVQPAPAQPKKPILGDVHLATPVVIRNRVARDGGEAAPNLDTTQTMENSDALGSGLAVANSTPPGAPAAPLPVGGDVKPARIIASVAPVYPALARNQRISGDVKIDALIDVNGRVTTMKVLSGPPLLQLAAMEALRQWKYQPATLDGKPTAMHLTVTLHFRSQ